MARRLSLETIFGRGRRVSDSQVQTDPEFDVDSVIEDGRIKSRVWKRLTIDQRKIILERIDDELYPMEVLYDICPKLRVEILPDDYLSIQSVWVSENQIGERSRSSIEVTRSALDAEAANSGLVGEIRELRSAMQNLFQQQNSRSYNVSDPRTHHTPRTPAEVVQVQLPYYHGWEGWNMMQEEPYYEDDTYQVFEDWNYRESVRRFCIQPFIETPNGYYNALHHILSENFKFRDIVMHSFITVNFDVMADDGRGDTMTFSSKMGFDEMMFEIDRLFDDDEGSDTYVFIRNHITKMSINCVTIPSGGGERVELLPLFIPIKIRSNNDDTCFYQCLRKIIYADTGIVCKTRTETMKGKISNLSSDTHMFPLDRIGDVCSVFGVNLIVFENIVPEIIIRDKSIKFDSYSNIKRDIIVRWRTYHPFSIDSNLISMKSMTGTAPWIVYNGVKYYTMIFHDSHYDLLKKFLNPIYCTKCGATDHTEEMALKDESIKVLCLNNLHDFLDQETIKRESPDHKLIFFDIETFVKNSYQYPYMLSFVVCDSSCNVLEKEVFEAFDCDLQFIRFINDKYKGLKYLIGFNSASFDNYFIMKSMLKWLDCNFSSSNSIVDGNRLLRLNSRGITTWDLYQFVKCSLKDACKGYGIERTKGDVDHKYVTRLFNECGVNTFKDPRYLELGIKEYCLNDSVLTMELYKKVSSELYNITGILPLSKPTLSSLIYQDFNIKFNKVPFEYNGIFDSIPGPRVQAFKGGKFDDQEYALIDINASYPSICINFEFGTGDVYECDEYSGDNLYICLCDVNQSDLKYKNVGIKDFKKNKKVVWIAKQVHNTWLQPEEINLLEEYGCTVNRKKYLVWTEKDYALRNKMKYYRNIRMKAKKEGNKITEKIAKLMSNGVTGKTGEKNRNNVWKIGKSQEDIIKHVKIFKETTSVELMTHNRFILTGETPERSHIQKPRHIAARIYALSRLVLWTYMMCFDEVLYCDTDSLIVPSSELSKIDLHDSRYGMMKLEQLSDEIYIVSSKSYYMNDQKMSLKNYHNGDLWEAKRGSSTVASGKSKCKELYQCLLDRSLVVTTTYTKITKKFVQRKDKKYELATLETKTSEKILQ